MLYPLRMRAEEGLLVLVPLLWITKVIQEYQESFFSISPHRRKVVKLETTAQVILQLVLLSSNEHDPLLVDYCHE